MDIKGIIQSEQAITALGIAIAGGHNIMLIGEPGTAKILLAKEAVNLLPDLSKTEKNEIQKIHQQIPNNYRKYNFKNHRPFGTPHWSISPQLLQDEIRLCHNGILLIDDFPELSGSAIDTLEKAMNDQSNEKFKLVLAMRPCPYGFINKSFDEAKYTLKESQEYKESIKSFIKNHIDLQVNLIRDDKHLDYTHSISEEIAYRFAKLKSKVNKAIRIQEDRYRGSSISDNAHIPVNHINKYCEVDSSASQMLIDWEKGNAFTDEIKNKLIRVARTISDLNENPSIAKEYLFQALYFLPKVDNLH